VTQKKANQGIILTESFYKNLSILYFNTLQQHLNSIFWVNKEY